MTNTDDASPSSVRLSAKDFAKKKRREAYEKAKARQKSDPKMIAMKEKLKQQRKDNYEKAKERRKSFAANRKKIISEKVTIEQQERDLDLMGMLVQGTDVKLAASLPSSTPETEQAG